MSAGIRFQEEVGSDKRRTPFWFSNLFAHAGHCKDMQFASYGIPKVQLGHINSTFLDIMICFLGIIILGYFSRVKLDYEPSCLIYCSPLINTV
jgi:hypothetical protein